MALLSWFIMNFLKGRTKKPSVEVRHIIRHIIIMPLNIAMLRGISDSLLWAVGEGEDLCTFMDLFLIL